MRASHPVQQWQRVLDRVDQRNGVAALREGVGREPGDADADPVSADAAENDCDIQRCHDESPTGDSTKHTMTLMRRYSTARALSG
jgi:hypothetical protein